MIEASVSLAIDEGIDNDTKEKIRDELAIVVKE